MFDRRKFLRASILLGLTAPLLAQTWPPPQSEPAGPSIKVTVGAPKERQGYYFAQSPDYQYVKVYSPKLPLTNGRQFSAVLTEAKTYRATLENEYVYVYIND